jgi:hypothetical protein
VGVWIASEEVMDKVILSPVLARVETELLEAIVTLSSVGGVLSNKTEVALPVVPVPELPVPPTVLLFSLTEPHQH